MEQNHDYEKACERYLLGELSEEKQALFEEAYFADDLLFERFLAVKDDLIDAFARGDLTGEKGERFEQHFLASGPRRQRVAEAKEFIRAVSANATNGTTVAAAPDSFVQVPYPRLRLFVPAALARHPFILRGAIAALLLLTLASSWAIVRHFQTQRAQRKNEEAARRQQEEKGGGKVVPPGNENRTDLAGNNPTNLSTNKATVNSNLAAVPDRSPQSKTPPGQFPQPLPAQVASLSLLPFLSRDAGSSNSLQIAPETRVVRLRLAFKGENYRHYDAILRTVAGEQVLRRVALIARPNGGGKSVTLTFAPSILSRQDYLVTLSGQTADGKLDVIGEYYFRVERTVHQTTPPLPD